MPPVFAHGRLRLYLLKLLEKAPRHGYEVIRLLEERFQGLYAPSAGTVYPRLAKLEQEGLVTHSTEGGRKVYAVTDAGRAELASRADEIAGLEHEIHKSVSHLAAEIRESMRDAAGDLRREVHAATQQAPMAPSAPDGKGQTRQAKKAAREARRQAQPAQEFAHDEMQRIARQVQDEVQQHRGHGAWQGGFREGLAGLGRELGRFGSTSGWPPYIKPDPACLDPEWGSGTPESGDPVRDLERLLDHFRDGIRDAARDHGVTAEQLSEARRHLSTAAAHIGAVLCPPAEDRRTPWQD
jgi:DNA-binding PadR family transcriptional regulator